MRRRSSDGTGRSGLEHVNDLAPCARPPGAVRPARDRPHAPEYRPGHRDGDRVARLPRPRDGRGVGRARARPDRVRAPVRRPRDRRRAGLRDLHDRLLAAGVRARPARPSGDHLPVGRHGGGGERRVRPKSGDDRFRSGVRPGRGALAARRRGPLDAQLRGPGVPLGADDQPILVRRPHVREGEPSGPAARRAAAAAAGRGVGRRPSGTSPPRASSPRRGGRWRGGSGGTPRGRRRARRPPGACPGSSGGAPAGSG